VRNLIGYLCFWVPATVLFATFFASCGQDPPEPTLDDIRMEGGRIVGPEWLVGEMEDVSDRYPEPASGMRLYPMVYSVENEGRDYILLRDIYTDEAYGFMYFTLSGEYVDPGAELNNALRMAKSTPLWRQAPKYALDNIEIADGRIVGPEWLVKEVEKSAERDGKPLLGLDTPPYLYLAIYSIEIEGEDYLLFSDYLRRDNRKDTLFSLSGDVVEGFAPEVHNAMKDFEEDTAPVWRSPMVVFSEEDIDNNLPVDEIEVADGKLSGPEWLVQVIKDVQVGLIHVWMFEHNGRYYLELDSPFASMYYSGSIFFTLSGQYAYPFLHNESCLFHTLSSVGTRRETMAWSSSMAE
jgi:hypothetical protein